MQQCHCKSLHTCVIIGFINHYSLRTTFKQHFMCIMQFRIELYVGMLLHYHTDDHLVWNILSVLHDDHLLDSDDLLGCTLMCYVTG